MNKKAIVIHSGGMDSSLCLALANLEFGREHVLSLSFAYAQRHALELTQAAKIARDWQTDHVCLDMHDLKTITDNALMNPAIPIEQCMGEVPNTLVIGRNGLMVHLAGIYAHQLKARYLYMGVMELEGANSGYRDCSRHYMDLQQEILRMDLNDPLFEVRTPLIRFTKKETLKLAHELGILGYLLNETISCYEGIVKDGCKKCPACVLRQEGIREFLAEFPAFEMPY